ncbi:MAG: YncE family protein, partial [Thermoleophilaceae bacterium]
MPRLPLPRSLKIRALVAVLALAALAAALSAVALAAVPGRIGPSLHIVNSGRHLTPYGTSVKVGNVPMGGALTPDGRFYWTVSAGAGLNDVRIVRVKNPKVVQTIPLPGASGGVTIDPNGGKAYVSGLADSTNKGTSRPKLPGGQGDVIHVFSYSKITGRAKETRQIGVPPPEGAPPVEDFPLHRSPLSYPEHLAVSGDGKTLLVPLGLSDAAA